MEKYQLTYKKFGESSILIEWPSRIDPDIIEDITGFEKQVSKHQKVIDTIIAYNSLTVRYDVMHNYSADYRHYNDFENTVKKLKELYATKQVQKQWKQKIWQIPVCYDTRFGIDLEELATRKKLFVEEIINLHTSSQYLVYFLGFQPGFLYLGGLDSRLHTPRRSNPRLRVDRGAVAIGGEQTGIYPQDSPGGWNIIGKSPVNFFDVSKSRPCFAKAGDYVQFKPVDVVTFDEISNGVKHRDYKPKFHWL